jgi:hypothetical protein
VLIERASEPFEAGEDASQSGSNWTIWGDIEARHSKVIVRHLTESSQTLAGYTKIRDPEDASWV